MSSLSLPRAIGHRGAAAYAPENTLEGIRDKAARAPPRLRSRLLLELAHAPGELVADLVLGLLEQVLLRLARREPGDSLELGRGVAPGLLQLLLELACVCLAVGDALLAPVELAELRLDLLLAAEHTFFDAVDLVATGLDLGLELGA